jgi:hypothetical protein
MLYEHVHAATDAPVQDIAVIGSPDAWQDKKKSRKFPPS